MKIFLIILFFLIVHDGYSQETKKIILSEFTSSINSSDVIDDNTKNRIGYGIGIFHAFEPSKNINLLLGLEFNHLSQFKYYMYDGHLASVNDITYNFNVLSFRFFPRFQLGERTKVFIEIGPQIDFGLYSNYHGTHKYLITSSYQFETQKESGSILYGANPYACGGIGISRKFSLFSIFIKSEYKIGLTKTYDMLEIKHRYIYFTLGLRRNKAVKG